MLHKVNETLIRDYHSADVRRHRNTVSCEAPLNSGRGLCKAEYLRDKDVCGLCASADGGIKVSTAA